MVERHPFNTPEPSDPRDARDSADARGDGAERESDHRKAGVSSDGTAVEFWDEAFSTGCRELELLKNGHRYVFRYEPGEESKLLSSLLEMAQDPAFPLDMFDAAILSHQIGQRLAEQLGEMLKP